jgi:hypothetical protein
MDHKLTIIFGILLAIFASCDTRSSRQAESESSTPATADLPSIQITPILNVPENFDAILELIEPYDYENIEPGKVRFFYDLRNFSLNSGNYIAMNLNNEHHLTTSNPELIASLQKGNYIAVSFLCLPNHISLKNYGNYVVRTFKIGNVLASETDDNAPMIFYNYPRGKVSKTNNAILLDFYLLNTSLSANGHKVKVNLAGQEFTLDDWNPYHIEGLPKGEHEIVLTLVDRNGVPVNNLYNSVRKTFQVQ